HNRYAIESCNRADIGDRIQTKAEYRPFCVGDDGGLGFFRGERFPPSSENSTGKKPQMVRVWEWQVFAR
ncbi:MAG TPA: hypothetical protein VFM77_08580, partial [Terriglobales bacterium]|nr:hypothetical protein [Terriglobales bacterium]